jgi:hypothetical protein
MGRTTVEQKANKYRVLNKLTYPEAINERELDAIAGGVFEDLIPVHAEKGKKGTILNSSIEGMMSLRSYFTSLVNKKMFLDVIVQIVAIVKECEKNHMNVNNLMLDDDYIFLDPRTKKLKCIFWPIVNNENPANISEFFRGIPFRIVFTKHEEHGYVSKYLGYFNNQGPFSINSFEKLLYELQGKKLDNRHLLPSGPTSLDDRNLPSEENSHSGKIAYNPFRQNKGAAYKSDEHTKGCPNCGKLFDAEDANFCIACGTSLESIQSPIAQGHDIPQAISKAATQSFSETTVLGAEDVGGTTVLGADPFEEPTFPYLIREKTQEKVSVDKPSFRIGKESSYCDYFIANNNAISRSHADIITKDNRYYIIDHNSTNKTYVDGRVIPVQKQVEIFSGTKIRLANEHFEFYI